ncbi:hypothetical protein HDV00_004414 [Rhizophlyctis rosea]|nr:hypothetical protein HDV00_004414 [Rhizophlyctis rosea]
MGNNASSNPLDPNSSQQPPSHSPDATKRFPPTGTHTHPHLPHIPRLPHSHSKSKLSTLSGAGGTKGSQEALDEEAAVALSLSASNGPKILRSLQIEDAEDAVREGREASLDGGGVGIGGLMATGRGDDGGVIAEGGVGDNIAVDDSISPHNLNTEFGNLLPTSNRTAQSTNSETSLLRAPVRNVVTEVVEAGVVGAGGAIVGALESVGRGVMGSFVSLSRRHKAPAGNGGSGMGGEMSGNGSRDGALGRMTSWGNGGAQDMPGAYESEAVQEEEELTDKGKNVSPLQIPAGPSNDIFAMEAGEAAPITPQPRNSIPFITLPPNRSDLFSRSDVPASPSPGPRKRFPKSAALGFVGGPLSGPNSNAPSRAGSSNFIQHVGVQLANATAAATGMGSALGAGGGGLSSSSRRGSAFTLPQPASSQTEIGLFPALQAKMAARQSISGESGSGEVRRMSGPAYEAGRMTPGAGNIAGSTPLRRVMNANAMPAPNGASIDSIWSSNASDSSTLATMPTPNTPFLLEAGLGGSRRSSGADGPTTSRQHSISHVSSKLADSEQQQQHNQAPAMAAGHSQYRPDPDRRSSGDRSNPIPPQPKSLSTSIQSLTSRSSSLTALTTQQPPPIQPFPAPSRPSLDRQNSNPKDSLFTAAMRNRSASSDSYHSLNIRQSKGGGRVTSQSPMPSSPVRRSSTPQAQGQIASIKPWSQKGEGKKKEEKNKQAPAVTMTPSTADLFENLQRAPPMSRHPHIPKYNSCSTLFVETTMANADLNETLRRLVFFFFSWVGRGLVFGLE